MFALLDEENSYIIDFNSIEFKKVNAGWTEPLKKGVFEITVLKIS